MSTTSIFKSIAFIFVLAFLITTAVLYARDNVNAFNPITCENTNNGMIQCGSRMDKGFTVLPENRDSFLNLFCEQNGEKWCKAKSKYSN